MQADIHFGISLPANSSHLRFTTDPEVEQSSHRPKSNLVRGHIKHGIAVAISVLINLEIELCFFAF